MGIDHGRSHRHGIGASPAKRWKIRTESLYDQELGALYATQSISTLQSTTILDTTHARAGGCSPKCSLKTALKAEKSRGSSSQTPQRTTCSVPYPASLRIDRRLRIAC